ncbi:enoyl-CoA hydratase/isomerase family protein [Bradyrhizobium sp. 153]|uniref:enoyl-CoA hydratase/isomerase family protein n=1 Tax=Bradyrhizobium sp. 153 TaxID=2782627 RepID=UPI001FF83830|nr:enoyl-CoA hydratase/isomerase family protein [Bradyrhizobium sp. 153]MCK1667697.1 enoyl-CoA hydratase/isomerase family protein [Bradyrhizobium sp. 153]
MIPHKFKDIALEQRGKVLFATLNRPDVRNAVSASLDDELFQLFSGLDADENTNVLVLTGAGDCFCAGGDFAEMLPNRGNMAYGHQVAAAGKRLLTAMLDCQKPVIARVNGDALGLGCTLALFCDIIIADSKARLSDQHVKIGLAAGDGGAAIWPQLVGYARAKQYLLTGDSISADEAERMGLINFSVPTDQLDELVKKWSEKFANGASWATRMSKLIVNSSLKHAFVQSVDVGFGHETLTALTSDHAEAIEAFLEKRRPQFSGR